MITDKKECDVALEMAAQCWGHSTTEKKIMDVELTKVFAEKLDVVIQENEKLKNAMPKIVNNSNNFRKALEESINCYSKENGSNTPDFLLADYLVNCLDNFDNIVKRREAWYGKKDTYINNDDTATTPEPTEIKI